MSSVARASALCDLFPFPICFSDFRLDSRTLREWLKIASFFILNEIFKSLRCRSILFWMLVKVSGSYSDPSFLHSPGMIQKGKNQENRKFSGLHQDNMSVKCIPPLTQYYIVKLGFLGGLPIFLTFALKHYVCYTWSITHSQFKVALWKII